MNLHLYMHDFDVAAAAAALAAIPRYLPTIPLDYHPEQGIDLRKVEDPAAWIVARAPTMESSMLCNGQEGMLVSMFANLIPPVSVVGREQLFKTSISFPEKPEYLAGVPALVRNLGPAMRAYWGDSTPGDAVLAIIRGAGNKLPLPSVDPLTVDMHARRPSLPGWANYWSYETCELLGFSLERGHGALFVRVEDLPGHGLFLQLTEEPLDLDRPDHMARLEALYDALPELARAEATLRAAKQPQRSETRTN